MMKHTMINSFAADIMRQRKAASTEDRRPHESAHLHDDLAALHIANRLDAGNTVPCRAAAAAPPDTSCHTI
jgi:hypothetical protein